MKNVLDNDGDLALVQSKRNANSGFFNYAKHFTYTAAGAVSSMQLGNGSWESTQFNSRLQPTQIALGNVQNATNKLKLDFTYNTSGQNDNNGNVLSQTITVPTETRNNQTYNGFTATQTYTYDSLNRIKDAKEMIGTAQQWRQTFLYDRYGNRRFDETNTTTLQQNCPTAVCNPQIDPATNKLIGYTFDDSGNTKVDAENRQFIYDAENKQVEVKDQSGVSVGKYFYDGDGKRVKKISATETTVFVYNASGQLVAEYSTQISQTPQVSYLTSDHLGSPRITTDANGQVISRRDFQPFGEEIARANYSADSVRQKFTSYERDSETDLDLAQARMYNKNHGRFTSTDPANLQAFSDISNPQSWNAYAYVNNNPCKYTDPTGTCICIGQRLGNIFKGYGNYSDEERNAELAQRRAEVAAYLEKGGTLVNRNTGDLTISAEELSDRQIWDAGHALRTGQLFNPENYTAEALEQVRQQAEAIQSTIPAPAVTNTGGTSGLTGSQSKAIRKIRNNIDNHLTEKDMQALIRDLSNNPLVKSRGDAYQHYKEVTNAVKGLKNHVKTLEKSLQNPNLSSAARTEIQQVVQEAKGYINRVEAIIRSH